MKNIAYVLILMLVLAVTPAWGQVPQRNINLNIAHIKQEAKQLCWAALVAQVVNRYAGLKPRQCDVVNMLNDINRSMPAACCYDISSSGCNITANENDIMSLLNGYGVKAALVSPPATVEEVYEFLSSGRALMLGLRTTATDNHIYLLTGLEWENNEPVLLINDSYYDAPIRVPFREAQPTWIAAIVIG